MGCQRKSSLLIRWIADSPDTAATSVYFLQQTESACAFAPVRCVRVIR